jgi:hypothetical protein
MHTLKLQAQHNLYDSGAVCWQAIHNHFNTASLAGGNNK